MKKQLNDLLNGKRIPPIKEQNVGGVSIRLMYDGRQLTKEDLYHISVCVTYASKRWYYLTGTTSSLDDYMRIVNSGNMGKWCDLKIGLCFLLYFSLAHPRI